MHFSIVLMSSSYSTVFWLSLQQCDSNLRGSLFFQIKIDNFQLGALFESALQRIGNISLHFYFCVWSLQAATLKTAGQKWMILNIDFAHILSNYTPLRRLYVSNEIYINSPQNYILRSTTIHCRSLPLNGGSLEKYKQL